MAKIYLVGCGAQKTDGFVPAREIYTHHYFEKKRRVAELDGDQWHVLSALYGLLDPSRKIAYYDVSIDDLKDWGVVDLWADKVRSQIRRTPAFHDPENELALLVGQQYLKPIHDFLSELPVTLVYPLEQTTGFGDQCRFLKDWVAKLEPGPETTQTTLG